MMVVLVLVVLLELGHARRDLGLLQQAVGEQDVLQGGEPALVVAPVLALPGADLGDQLLPKALPLESVSLRQRDGDSERTALPRLLEDELAVRARRRRRALDVDRHRVSGRPVPIIASRVTSCASSSSDSSSVPSGRSGS